MPDGKRLLVLGLLLTLTLCAVAWVSDEQKIASDDVVVAVSDKVARPRKDPTSRGKSPEGEQFGLALNKLQRSTMAVGERNPFDVKSWHVPPPPAPPSPPPALPPPLPPTAPVLPFVYMGKMDEGSGRWIVYLVKGEQFFAVRKGETFDNTYRIDGIENGNLVIQYLPLSIKQYLLINSES